MIKTSIAAAAAALMLAAAWPAVAAPDVAALRATYDKDRAACNKKPAGDARNTCLREAGAAYDAARKGQLRSPDDAERNARARCDPLPQPQRDECLARAKGEGETTVQGSVEGGGTLRETVTRTITPAASAAAETASAASASQP